MGTPRPHEKRADEYQMCWGVQSVPPVGRFGEPAVAVARTGADKVSRERHPGQVAREECRSGADRKNVRNQEEVGPRPARTPGCDPPGADANRDRTSDQTAEVRRIVALRARVCVRAQKVNCVRIAYQPPEDRDRLADRIKNRCHRGLQRIRFVAVHAG